MNTCDATMIHIITTCGNDSNQTLKCNLQINSQPKKRFTEWARECHVAYSDVGLAMVGPLEQNRKEREAATLKQTQSN